MLARDKVLQAFREVGVSVDDPTEPTERADWQAPTEYPDSADGELDHDAPMNGAMAKPVTLVPSPRFVPVAIDDVAISAEPIWLIDGLLPARGLAFIVGPPKSGKSYMTSYMLCAVARGALYAGRQTLPGPVIYLTGEGVKGFERRLIAMRQHLEIEGHGVPFFMVDRVPDLGSEATDLPQFIADLTAFIKLHAPDGVRAIAIDTLARSMGAADENSARDMGRFIERCAVIERHFKCMVVVVHHVRKDASRGGRGSNAQNGAADVTMLVEKFETYSKVRIEEFKDGREGQEWTFRLLSYDLSATFDDGCAGLPQPVESSTCIVEILSEPGKAQPRATNKAKAPSGVAGDLLKIIRIAVDEAGTTSPDSPAVPLNVRAASKDDLKRYCETMAWQDALPDNSWRAMFSKSLSQLRAREKIGFDKRWVWLR
jgi:hypothetical protein